MMVNDYGHHPTEVRSTIVTVREGWPSRRLCLVFQPHRYSRTQALMKAFVSVLAMVDVLILLPVYASGETAIVGVNSEGLASEIKRKSGQHFPEVYTPALSEVATLLPRIVQEKDIVLFQGAGNIATLAAQISQNWTVKA